MKGTPLAHIWASNGTCNTVVWAVYCPTIKPCVELEHPLVHLPMYTLTFQQCLTLEYSIFESDSQTVTYLAYHSVGP